MVDHSWPSFLNLLDKNPDKAFREFYSFTYKLLKVKPPKGMQGMSEMESEDLIHEIVLHCVTDDFKVLHQYLDRGKPFAAWLYVLAHNMCLDYLRKRKRDIVPVSEDRHPYNPNLNRSRAELDSTPEKRARLKGVIDTVGRCISKLGEYCQLLLQLAADEYSPREIVQVLRLPADENKKISDDLRGCRKRLKKLFAEEGVDLLSLLSN